MAIDLEAIKKRLSQLNGTAKKDGFGNVWWRPEVREEPYRVRVVPFPDNNGQPFKEIWYYNSIGVPNERGKGPFPMPTLKQFNKPDPIQELINMLRDEDQKNGTDTNKPMLKKLYPKLTTVVAVIVRGEEDKGVRLWPIKNPKLYEQLLAYFVDSDVLEETADWTDVNTGCDLKVKIFESGKIWNGNKVKDTSVEMRVKSVPLSADAEQIKKWMSGIPDVFSVDPVPTYDEAKKRLEMWLNAGAGEKAGDGAERGTDSSGADLDKLASDVKEDTKPSAKSETKTEEKSESKAEAKAQEPKAEKPKADKKPAKKVENTEKELEEMFNELENGS